MIRRIAISSLVLLATLAHESVAQDMRRCQRADGSVVYTDRQCEPGQNEQATAATAASAPPQHAGRTAVAPPPACSETAGDLVHTVRTAVASHDVNLLARSYHWPGLGDAQVESVLKRLDMLVQRPLVDIRLLYPETAGGTENDAPVIEAGSVDAETGTPPESASAERPVAPIGLKLLQRVSPAGDDIVGTRFGLLRHFDCWWIRY
jgi:hypothetical protein